MAPCLLLRDAFRKLLDRGLQGFLDVLLKPRIPLDEVLRRTEVLCHNESGDIAPIGGRHARACEQLLNGFLSGFLEVARDERLERIDISATPMLCVEICLSREASDQL
jgi:hypothetical protein